MSLFISMFGVGLLTSIHCVFMCGGLVLSYAVKGTEDGPWYRRLVPHLAYQGAKIVSYATVALALGGLVALLGTALDITPVRNWLLVAAGVYMVLLGLSMTGKLPWLSHLSPRAPKALIDALSRNRKKAVSDAGEGHASLATPITFGLLTGLMPCAPLIAAQAAAISAGSPLAGAAAMAGFGLGTAPLMLAFGFGSSMLSRRFQQKLQVVAAIVVIVFGLVIFNRGLMVVGSPVTFDTVKAAVVSAPVAASSDTEYDVGADGVVEVPLVIENTQFVPKTVSIPADVPVRLVVDRREANACSAQLAVPQARVLADLKDNAVTKVDLPAMSAGSYTLTCGMGMMEGSLSVGGGAPASAGVFASPLPWLALALGGAGVALYVAARRKRGDVPAPAAAPAKTHAKTHAPAQGRKPAPAGAAFSWLGFTPVELAFGTVAVLVAIIAGLAFGGFFG